MYIVTNNKTTGRTECRMPSLGDECMCSVCRAKKSQPAAPAVGERDLPPLPQLALATWDSGITEWAIVVPRDSDLVRLVACGTEMRISDIGMPTFEVFPRGWSKAVPSTEIDRLRAECEKLRAKCETESRAATYWWRAYMALAKGSCPEPTIEGDRQAVKEFEDYEKQLSWIADSLAGVQGALADAGGEILCIREDGNYGESVRQIVGERDSLRAKLAEAEAKVGKMLELHRHVEAAHVFCSECERIAKGA